MKFLSKDSMKKTAIILIFLTLFNFMIPTYSNAGLDETLMNPVKDLLIFIGDGILGIMQWNTLGVFEVTMSSDVAKQMNGFTKGLAYTANGVGNFFGGVVSVITFGGINPDWGVSNLDKISDVGYIRYTPDKIFTNQIPLFDVNFFKPKDKISFALNGIQTNIKMDEVDRYKEAVNRLVECNYSNKGDAWNDAVILLEFTNRIKNDLNSDNEIGIPAIQDFCAKIRDDYMDSNTDIEKTKNDISQMKAPLQIIYTDVFNESNSVVSKSSAKILRETVSKWYVILETIALVGMLSVLVYTGIRILITSVAKDKAKYKQMLIDWLVGICLLIFMQYIMSFSFNFVDKITDMVNKMCNGSTSTFFNNARTFAGYSKTGFKAWGYTVIYLILVFITVYFTFVYLKRVVYMAFLTMISPLVAFTYPIDKMGDGSAQAFNMWFKEYIFNLLIQPMHLILYTVLIGTAADLANEYVIYAIVALGFMTQAEKLLRKFFGFEKASTPGLLPVSAGGALMMEGFRKLTGWGPHAHNGKAKAPKVEDKGGNKGKIKTRSINPYEDNGKLSSRLQEIENASNGASITSSGNSIKISGGLVDGKKLTEDILIGNDKKPNAMPKVAATGPSSISSKQPSKFKRALRWN